MSQTLSQRFSKAYNNKKVQYQKNLDQLDGELKAMTDIFVESIENCLADIISEDLDKPVDVLPQRQYKILIKLYAQGVKPDKICLNINTGLTSHPGNYVVTSNELSLEPPKDFIESKVLPSLDKALQSRGIELQNRDTQTEKYPYEVIVSFEKK